MLNRNALVVVADGKKATLYRNVGRGEVELSEEKHLTPTNLSDETASGPLPEEQTPRDEDEATFAKQLARALNAMVLAHKAEEIVVVADPKTLGHMRQSYHGELSKRIVKEVSKTMTHASPAEIAKALS